MSSLLLGWPNGVLGMLLGTLAGLLIILQAWRDAPWDIHDEQSYSEPPLSLRTLAPSLVLFVSLLTLLFGIGALDKGVWPPLAIAGDILGLIALPVSAYCVFTRPKRPLERADERRV